MPLAHVEATIEGALTNIVTPGKSETDDTVKMALLPGASGIGKQMPDLKKDSDKGG